MPAASGSVGDVVVRSRITLVSAGTERMLVDFGKGSWVAKARQQPDKVRMVLEKVRTDGLTPTIEAVFNKLDQPLPLGYCNVGRIVSVGSHVSGLTVGQRVVSNGKHAEVVAVPKNLCARVPDAVGDEEAAFTVLGAIGLQGVRLAQPTFGESVVVVGLGLIGLMTVQLLRANGCRVLGVDFDRKKLELAQQFGAATVDLGSGEDLIASANVFSRGRGVDAVLITASTKSSEPVHQAARICRKRGRIVLVGVAGLELSRADFYEKELSFQVSCSYGPGRYDSDYEEKGFDYPVGFVRWTEQRNFEAVLDAMASGQLDVKPLISHRFEIDDAPEAYELVSSDEPSLGILLSYPGRDGSEFDRTVAISPSVRRASAELNGSATARLGFVGSGNYASAVLIPAFSKAGARMISVASKGGVSSAHVAMKFDFETATTDADSLIERADIDAVVISTRHDSHARLIIRSLGAGKHVFVEKPLCLNHEELSAVKSALEQSGKILMVGFNRRFSPCVAELRKQLATVGAACKAMTITVNAGFIPSDHWVHDPKVGGGRIVGEGCHFVDLLRYLAGAPITEWTKVTLAGQSRDSAVISLKFADGSIGSINYLANGNKEVPKERIEVFAGGRVFQIDNFRTLRAFGQPGFRKFAKWSQDKGQNACAAAFLASIAGGDSGPIPVEELLEVARVSIDLEGAE